MSTINGLDVKRELVRTKFKEPQLTAMLSGFVRSCMALTRNAERKYELELDCQTDFVRDFIVSAMFGKFKLTPRTDGSGLRYADCEKLLRRLYIFDPESDGLLPLGIPERFKQLDQAYVRGVFLGCGSCSVRRMTASGAALDDERNPGGYHIEFSFVGESFADEFCELLELHDIRMHRMVRGEKIVVYAKDSETAINCLSLLGVGGIVLDLCQTVATMSLKRNINRRINCDMANMTRATNAAVDVTKAIETIEGMCGLGTLPPKLLEAADARMNSPDASLSDLAYELGISKSGLKHRYDKIIEMARELEERSKK